MVEKLVNAGFNTLESLLNATEEDISSVFGFAQITALALVNGLAENRDEMISLVSSGIIILEKVEKHHLNLMECHSALQANLIQ